MSTAPIRVMLVDDDPDIHEMVSDLTLAVPDVILIGETFRGEEAPTLAGHCEPDIVLMDVQLPGMSGMQTTRILKDRHPDLKILVLSSFHEYVFIKEMLDAGALGYLVKDALFDDLIHTIRLTYQGKTVLSPDVARKVFSPPDTGPKETFNLTDREREVLMHLATGRNNGEIAALLEISSATVRFHTKNIIQKMGVETRSEALVLAAKSKLI